MCNTDKPIKAVSTDQWNVNHCDAIITENHLAQEPDDTNAGPDQADTPQPDSFLSRLCSLPIIRASVETVEFYANKTSLSKFALEKTKETFDQATFVAFLFTSKYKYQTDRVDQLGCRSLDALEYKFPIVRQYPGEVLTEVKATPKKLYNDAKDKLTTTVSRRITFTTDNLEFLIDKYLPKRESNNTVIDESTMTETTKLFSLANQVLDRIAYGLKFVYLKADLYQLIETNRLLSNVTQSITDTYHKLFETVEAFKNEIQTTSSECIDGLTSNLIHCLDKAAHYLKLHLVYLGPLQPLVNPLVDIVTHEYGIIRREALKSDLSPLQKATNILCLTKEYALPSVRESANCIQKQINHSNIYHNKTDDALGNNITSDADAKTQAENKKKQY